MQDTKPGVHGRNPASGSSPAATPAGPVTRVRPGGTSRRHEVHRTRVADAGIDIDQYMLQVAITPLSLQMAVLPYSTWLAIALVPAVLALMAATAGTDVDRIRPPLHALARWFFSIAWLPGAYLAACINTLAEMDDVLITVTQGVALFAVGLTAIRILIRTN